MIGHTLGHYEIVEKLGAGGMGEVYRARDPRLGRDVALKVVSADDARGSLEAYLINEARQAATLSHANICHIYDVGQADGRTFFAMELVPGKTLAQAIPPGGLPPDTAMRYGRQVAAALAHAHERGVIHRDLKTANIVITPSGEAKVLDFGLAKRIETKELDELTHSRLDVSLPGTLVGTLPYMAPEVLRGEPATERSDLWALGVLLFEMAAGVRPFAGKTAIEASSAILHLPVPPLPEHWPPALREAIARCLEKDPAQRCGDAGVVGEVLDVASATLTGPVPGPPPRARARQALFMAAGAAVAVALLSGGWWLWGRKASPSESASTSGPPASAAPGSALRPSKVPEANEHFQRANLIAMSSLDLPRVRESLKRALEADPTFAEARAQYGFMLALEVIAGWSSDVSWMYRGEQEVRRALADDPECGRAHSALAGIYFYQGRKELVPGEVERALALNPNDLAAYGWVVSYYAFIGDYARAQGQADLALALDPMFFPVRMMYADMLVDRGEMAAAVREADKLIEQAPENPPIIFVATHAYLVAGDSARARAILDGVPDRLARNFQVLLARALLLAVEGRANDALATLDAGVLKYAGSNLRAIVRLPEIYSVLDRRDDALDWLDRSIRMGDERAEWFERNPLLANVRKEPRFAQLMESVRYRRAQRK